MTERALAADPSDQLSRFEQAQSLIGSARQLLKENKFLLQTLSYPRGSIRRLDYIRDFWVVDRSSPNEIGNTGSTSSGSIASILESIESSSKGTTIQDQCARTRVSIAKLQCVTVELVRGIAREIGDVKLAYERMREIAARVTNDKPLTQEDVNDFLHSSESISSHVKGKLTPDLQDRPSRLHEWVRWWRWCGMLGIASRSFDRSESSLLQALTSLPLEHPEDESATSSTQLSDFPLSNLGFKALRAKSPASEKGSIYKLLSEVLHTLELSAHLFTLKAHTCSRLASLQTARLGPSKNTVATYNSSHKYLKSAERFAIRGLNLIEDLENSGEEREGHDIELGWYQSRLLMAVGIASLYEPDRKLNSRHAMGFMSDAAACLQSALPLRSRADLALVELRRADVRLQEVGQFQFDTSDCSQSGKLQTFEVWIYERLLGGTLTEPLERLSGASQLESISLLKKQLHSSKSLLHPKLREIHARSLDAMRFLDRAEPILRERRRNVWWTSWYFERRLRAMSFILWAGVFNEESPIPFLGLGEAMYLIDTQADNLLNDAVRMIRIDGYRLAMIVLSYASCARALQTRFAVDETSQYLPKRLMRMRVNLDRAVRQLNEVERRRAGSSFPPDTPPAKKRNSKNNADKVDKHRIDDLAMQVISEVKILSRFVIESLPSPTRKILSDSEAGGH